MNNELRGLPTGFARSVLPAVALMAMAPALLADTPVDRTVDAHPRGEVSINNTAGEIRVIGWGRDQVRVTGTLGDGAEGLNVVSEGKYTSIKVEVPRRSRRVSDSEIEVRVPAGSRINVTSVAADILVEGVKGAQRLHSVSGDIETEVYEEDAALETVNGNFDVRGHDEAGLLTINTVTGDGDIRNIRGEIEAQSVNGDLEIEGSEFDRARVKTTNGDVTLEAGMADRARFEMDAINGELRLDILGDVNAEFDIETFNGGIRNDFGHEPQRKSRYGPGWMLRFTEGNGDARVRIKTLNGDVEVRSR